MAQVIADLDQRKLSPGNTLVITFASAPRSGCKTNEVKGVILDTISKNGKITDVIILPKKGIVVDDPKKMSLSVTSNTKLAKVILSRGARIKSRALRKQARRPNASL